MRRAMNKVVGVCIQATLTYVLVMHCLIPRAVTALVGISHITPHVIH